MKNNQITSKYTLQEMENELKNPKKQSSENLETEFPHKLTSNDIDIIEKYRQTRKTSVLSILFTDIVGYTKFTYRAGESISAKFRHIHDDIIISQIKKDGHGEIIKQIGDSFLIVFSDPTIAVKQALKLQELLRVNSENLTYKDYQLKIRIGLHMGQVSVEDHIIPDVFGTHVNLASRVMSLAKGGQVIVSGSVWENASGWLKDEQDKDVQSVFYGKTKLKGIGKATDIYEFYNETIGKKGVPKILLKNKRKKRIIAGSLILFLVLIFVIPFIFLWNSSSKKDIKSNEIRTGKIFLADIDSYHEDRMKKSKNSLEVLDAKSLDKLNEKYQSLLKTDFIAEYDIENETEVKNVYAKHGLTIPQDFRNDTTYKCWNYSIYDTSILYSGVFFIMPHLYKINEDNGYYIFVDYDFTGYLYNDDYRFYNSKTSSFFSHKITDIDSVPIIINKGIRGNLLSYIKSRYSKGRIISISGNDVIIQFEKNLGYKMPKVGVDLTATRCYTPWTKISDSGVIIRINDLEEALNYYGSPEEWIRNIDTSNHDWSYNEYRSLKDSTIKFGGATTCCWSLNIDMKLIEVYDSTALAKIQYIPYPWLKPEVGDEVSLK